MGDVVVLAVLGTSPAVLTELAWWLVQREGHRVVAMEVWTTIGGADALRRQAHRWRQLVDALPEGSVPAVGDLVARRPDELEPARGLGVVVPHGPDGPLADIRSPEEAEVLAAGLYDRVRALRAALPESVRLIGSLAGGRKTMSSALEVAFTLQADAWDRLVHVLVHPRIEADRERFTGFSLPNTATERAVGVGVDEQVAVYDVPFPALQGLLDTHSSRSALRRSLRESTWEQVWTRLRTVRSAAEPRAHLLRRAGGWALDVHLGDRVVAVPLTRTEADTYAALVQHPEGADDATWQEWLESHPRRSPHEPRVTDHEANQARARKRRSDLAKKLAQHLPGDRELSIVSRDGRWVIPGARRVTVDPV